ncbi:hypothetical protein BSF37_06740 [Serratia marcescens]|nr:hypothetical protein [Serratia marcescens]
MKLNARQVETATPKDKTYKMADGGGLYLEVTTKGSQYWRMKYRRPNDKKEDRFAFGVWPTIQDDGALGESGLWSDDAIERQLSHSERNNVRAAYIHTSEHLESVV